MRLFVFGLAVLALAPAAQAQTMNAEAFNKRAQALARKGPFALFSRGEINALMVEGTAAGRASNLQRKADLAAGRTPRFCLPQGNVGISSTEFMRGLGAIPAAERVHMTMTEATNRILAAKYPCKG
jgi:hypothetical protein